MSLAELTGLKEQVPFLEGRLWEEVKSLKSAALHCNPEHGAEKARAQPVHKLMFSLNELQPQDPFFPSIAMCHCYLRVTVVA